MAAAAPAAIAPPQATPATGIVGKNVPLFLGAGIAVVMVILYTWLARWRGLTLSIDVTHVMDTLSPLLLTAAFIERAVEVIVSPWRDANANQLDNKLNALKAQTAPPASPQDIQQADSAFQNYTGQTQKYAFAASITLSLAAAYVGVRALWPFVNQADFGKLSANQQWMFLAVDVVLTAALLAGGADGIHQVVNAFTTFFSSTAEKATRAASAPTQ